MHYKKFPGMLFRGHHKRHNCSDHKVMFYSHSMSLYYTRNSGLSNGCNFQYIVNPNKSIIDWDSFFRHKASSHELPHIRNNSPETRLHPSKGQVEEVDSYDPRRQRFTQLRLCSSNSKAIRHF